LANHHPVALLEYLLWKYHKSAAQLFTPPKGVDPALLRALDEAIEQFKQILAVRQAREEKMRQLEVAASVGGVKGMAARNQLEQMKQEDELEQRKRELTAAAAKRKAQKAVDNDTSYAERVRLEKEKAMAEEQERLAREQQEREEAERLKKEESRNRLKAKAALWS
jgi:hypothetical protein